MSNVIEVDGKKYKMILEEIKEEVVEYPAPKFIASGVEMKTRWSAAPKGLIVHYHCGWTDSRINSIPVLKLGKKNGYKYMCMEENGDVYYPNAKLSFWEHGAHSGTKHHYDHVGIEVINSGKLQKRGSKFYTWFDKEIPSDRVIAYERKDNIVEGYYEVFTDEQIKSLVGLCHYMKDKYESFSFDNVLGHDEVAVGRKNDPGGSLTMTMPEFRKLVKRTYKKKNIE
jgi:N-acetyl-anhydromuramyl-L-alanine amidase AmpD